MFGYNPFEKFENNDIMLKGIACYLLLLLYSVTISGLVHYASTDMGTIMGKLERTHFKDKTYQYVSYLGIPYAEESFDFWRFRKPRVPKRFKEPYNATYIRPSCLQLGFGRTRQTTSENCLYLNIYAPSESTINPVKTFPVLIYLHGGDFKVGSANDVSPEVLSSYGDIIVVTVNYRLGVFGFFSTGDHLARGNFGLWDQHFAIKWIRYNIASFGGDIQNITLLGQTAGAASALYQGLYPGNRGLFQRIIAVNGNSRSPWAINPPNAKFIGKKLECITYDETRIINNDSMVACIKDSPSIQLLKIGAEMNKIGPTIDGEFLTDHPAKLLMSPSPMMPNISDAREFFQSLDIIIGYTQNNGDILLQEILSPQDNVTEFKDMTIKRGQFEYTLIPRLVQPIYDSYKGVHNQEVSFVSANHVEHVVRYHYTNWSDPDSSDNIKSNLQNISRDINFIIPSLVVADSHFRTNKNASTYLFRFDYNPAFRVWDSPWLSRVGTGLETLFIFGLPPRMTQEVKLERRRITERDYQLTENMMKWISNFATTGNPNKPSPLLGNTSTPDWTLINGTWTQNPSEIKQVTWLPYDDHRTFLTFSTNMSSSSVMDLPGEPDTSFWLILIPALLRDIGVNLFTIPDGVPEDVKPFLVGVDIPVTEARSVIVGLVAISGGLLISIIAIVCYVCKVFC